MRKMRKVGIVFLAVIVVTLLSTNLMYAQTTGKISGKIVDASTNDPLAGANVFIEGTTMGAAAGPDGDYFILNVPPGTYTLRARMIGYNDYVVQDLRVSVNRTTYVNVELKTTVLEGQEVVVQADKIVLKKDQTSSIRNVSSEQMEMLPVENIGAVVSMQAGVVNGHFRGGRNTEVAYLVDGVEVTESFNADGRAVELEPESIQDLEVITGTFNAEYGKAMSGIVNAVTKDGGNKFSGSVSAALANYFTSNDDVFIGLKSDEFDRNQDYKLQLSGPIWKNRISFFTNFRYQNNKNHLNGVRRFNVNDFSFFADDNPDFWYSEHSGDSSYVPMDQDINTSFMGKLTFKLLKNVKTSFLYTWNDDEWKDYDHAFKYNPDGKPSAHRETHMYTFQMNHMLSPRLFYELKVSYMDNYNGWYVFEDEYDPGYVADAYYNISGPGFYTGGQDKTHSAHTMKDFSTKLDFTWQANKNHSLKSGLVFTHHNLKREWFQIRNKYSGMPEEAEFYFNENGKLVFPNYEPVVYPSESIYTDIFHVYPIEFSGYFQDKMEFKEMVLNFGVRYDMFDPRTTYPSQLRNPGNQLDLSDDPEKMSTYPDADIQYQISPRFGLSYQLAETALLHFSYGHFFKMPPMYSMYENRNFIVAPTDYQTTMGNPNIQAEKTVQYEIGLWQEIMDGMGLEVVLFYRDIYDLLSAKVISTFNQIEYGLYSNKDYGNVKGLELKYDFVYRNFSAFLNYTLQYTRGNADNPTQTFDRLGESQDPVNKFIPMSWDQRHTVNLTVGYNARNYGVTMTAYYNSGSPYTWSPIAESQLARINLFPNNAWRPERYSVDLNSYYDFNVMDGLKMRVTLTAYNLLDRLNEEWVNGQTGRAYTAIVRPADIANHRSDFNEFSDTYQNPSAYSAPRQIKIGLGLMF